MTYSINTETASTKELVAFYNAHAHNIGKKTVVKFTDRATAQLRVRMMVEDLNYAPVEAEVTNDVFGFETHGLTRCPHCDIHLNNGVGYHNQEVNGKTIKHAKFEFECLACGEEFGPAIPAKPVKVPTDGAWSETRDNMKTSLKLDRTIVAYEGDELQGTWSNAYRMWKDNPEWMTSGQQDRLTAKLYAAAKLGDKIKVEINGRSFELVNV